MRTRIANIVDRVNPVRFVEFLSALLIVACATVTTTGSQAAPPHEVDLLTDTSAVRLDGEELGDGTGTRVVSCDVNGDGLNDVVISAPGGDGPGNSRIAAGEVYVLFGSRGPWIGPLSIGAVKDSWIYGALALDSLGDGIGCGDVDGDGFADLILGAPFGDGAGDLRPASGQVHIIPGSPTLAQEVDLAADSGIVLHGAVENDTCGDNVIPTGDINGDGIDDIAIGADDAVSLDGTAPSAGRAHVVFGRSDWPGSIDLLSDDDVTIHGADFNDFLGRNLAIGDVDADGTAELLVAAQGGDGPLDNRSGAGDIYVFRGRVSWPAVIDLELAQPDMFLYGPDPNDLMGGTRNIAVGDLDGDGMPEIAAGSQEAAGKLNDSSNTGEVRLYEPGLSLPLEVDLGLSSDSVAYGEELGDFFCSGTRMGDINGDGIDDLACDAPLADGPDNTRPSSAEIYVFFGSSPFSQEFNLSEDDHDLVIYGAHESFRLALKALADVNGDGLDEIIASSCVVSSTCLPSVWMISPFDIDGDSISQLQDNCPRAANGMQADGDGDLIGDKCDNCPDLYNTGQQDSDSDGVGDGCDLCPGQPGSDASDPDGDGVTNCTDNCPAHTNANQLDEDEDGIGDACDACLGDSENDPDGDSVCATLDNCPWAFNFSQRDSDGDGFGDLCDNCPADHDPAQLDADGDGAGDLCDCQPNDLNDRGPARVENLVLVASSPTSVQLTWEVAAGSDVYSITRGDLSAVADGQYGPCLVEGLADPVFEEPELPAAGAGFSYLVQGQSFECDLGPLGLDSGEEQRSNSHVSACQGHVTDRSHAQSEASIWGTTAGTYSDTHGSDNVRESITEELSPGPEAFKFSVLEHHWAFTVTPGERIEIHVEAYRGSSPDGDTFAFEYSDDDGGSWFPIDLGDLPLFDDETDRVSPLPPDLSGAVMVRVVDTNRSQGHRDLDTVHVDEIFLRSIPPAQ